MQTNLSLSIDSGINGICKKIKLQSPQDLHHRWSPYAHRKASSTEQKSEKRAWINILFSGESEAVHLNYVYHLTKLVVNPASSHY